MGLILDTSILIAGERRGEAVEDILDRVRAIHGEVDIGMSSVSVVEMTHGIYRAHTSSDKERRRIFCEKTFRDILVYAVSFEIALLAGQIEGEQAALGNIIALEDLVIGATALHLGFHIATLNMKHFQKIPGLKVVSV